MKYVAVVGSRGFNDYDLFLDKIRLYTKNIEDDITFVSGGAPSGADFLIEKFCREHDMPIIVYKANWDKDGRSAGFMRNITIIAKANYVIAFWDGKSRGTEHSITLAKGTARPLRIVNI